MEGKLGIAVFRLKTKKANMKKKILIDYNCRISVLIPREHI